MKKHYSCAELANMKLPGLPASERRMRDLVDREGWEYTEIKSRGRGGIKREYTPPAKIAKLIAAHSHIKQDGHAAAAARAAMAAVKAQTRAEKQAKTKMAVSDMMATLSVNGREKFEANFDIVLAFRNYYAAHNANGQAMRRNEAFSAFAEDYNAKRVQVSEAVRAQYTNISPRSIQRWVLDNEKNGLVACADRRSVRGKVGRKSIIEQNPDLEKTLIAIITEKPHIKNTHLCDIVNEYRLDRETGVIAWETVSYDAICRWREAFEDQNKQALLAVTNPDKWKNKYLSALGKQDEDVHRLNQRWEMDGTPSDWMLVGGRYTASVVIDVWSRRPKILFSKTPRTETNKLLLRQAIMEWGVPEEAKTDNGTDYTSRELRIFFEEMGIQHTLSTPFSPWEKPHVERFIKTFLHGILEMLDSFIGHNVAERKQIEAKRTFAENLFKKNAVVDVDMTVDELQTLADQWIEGMYMPREHRTLGVSPLEKAASYTGPLTRITNERAFDILLAKPAGSMPIITKKGIRHDKATFIHPELPIHQGKQADIRLDPNDLGRLIVYVDGKFLCIAECPERTGMDRQEVAAHARQKQQAFINEKKREYRAAKAALPMSTDALVREILVNRAAKAGKVAVLAPRVQEHETAALREAERVIQSQTPSISPEHAALIEEARQLHAAARNPQPEIILLPVQHSKSPLEGMTDEAKYDLWLELDGTVRAGSELTEPWQQRFHAGFPRTSAYRSIVAMRQMESPSERQL